MFQAYNLITVLSARENVEFIMQVQGVPAKEREKLATGVLAEAAWPGSNRRPAELSGGQQQRVAVARAIATRPALVLADEPTANLDSRSAARLMDLFVTLNRERGVTFVISTHDARVMGYARRLIGMRDGRIVSDQGAAASRHGDINGRQPRATVATGATARQPSAQGPPAAGNGAGTAARYRHWRGAGFRRRPPQSCAGRAAAIPVTAPTARYSAK